MPLLTTLSSRQLSGLAKASPVAPTPQYLGFSSNSASYNEGDTVVVTVTTANVLNGTTVGYTITGLSVNDISGGQTSGTITINNNSGTAQFTLVNDLLTEGTETPVVTLSSSDNAGTLTGGLTASFTVVDTSNDPSATPWLDSTDNLASVRLIIGSTSMQINGVFASNPSVPRTIQGRTSGTQTTIIAITARTGTYIEVDDTGNSTNFVIGEQLNLLSINYTVTPAANNVNEGSSLTFTVTTTNLPNGYTLYWTASAASEFAVSSGSFTVNNNTATFSVTPTADATTEGAETFTVSIRSGSVSGTVLATSSSVTINDVSVAPQTMVNAVSNTNMSTILPAGVTEVATGYQNISPSLRFVTTNNTNLSIAVTPTGFVNTEWSMEAVFRPNGAPADTQYPGKSAAIIGMTSGGLSLVQLGIANTQFYLFEQNSSGNGGLSNPATVTSNNWYWTKVIRNESFYGSSNTRIWLYNLTTNEWVLQNQLFRSIYFTSTPTAIYTGSTIGSTSTTRANMDLAMARITSAPNMTEPVLPFNMPLASSVTADDRVFIVGRDTPATVVTNYVTGTSASSAQTRAGISQSMNFSGTQTQSLSLVTDPAFATYPVTVEAWVYSSAAGGGILNLQNTGTGQNLLFFNSGISNSDRSAATGTQTSGTAWNTGAWQHIAFTMWSSTGSTSVADRVTYFVNGNAAGQAGGLLTLPSAPTNCTATNQTRVLLGMNQFSLASANNPFNGFISEVRVSSGARYGTATGTNIFTPNVNTPLARDATTLALLRAV